MLDKNKIKISINNNEKIEINKGMTIAQIIQEVKGEKDATIVAAKVNNELRELTYEVEDACNIEFIDVTTADGSRIYQRSLSFVFIRAAMEIFPKAKVTVEHSLSKGLYCEIHDKRKINKEDVSKIEDRMDEIVKDDVPLLKNSVSLEKARNIFTDLGMSAKTKLMEFRDENEINIYSCGWLQNYFYGYMVPSTGYLKLFELKYYEPGLILRFPEKSNPNELPEFKEQKKLASIFREAEKWGGIMEVPYVADLNKQIQKDTYPELIRIAEGLHEKKIVEIANRITEENKRIILIAGPSSSGKTTFAQRLAIQLKVNGLKPISVSLDDYFVNREHTPIDENGEYDFEALEAVELELFNNHLTKLLNGERVEIPTFNFYKGEREYNGKYLEITKKQPIIIEGIHGLNDQLTQSISHDKKFKIYISALTQLNIDNHNRIPTTDGRLIRRIVRDSKYRGHSALTTLKLW
ncbi:nucleoside kinase, partial [Lutibacter sp. B2]|nr:nucleoside kinase [Lutibacter sp. B2]